MAMTGGAAEEPVSVALSGMGVGGGFLLLILAGVATSLAIGVLKLREWARIISIASIAAGIAFTVLSLFAFRRYMVIPLVPSIVCHLLVVIIASCMAEYLSRARIKRVFNVATWDFH
jgi:glycerol-3-phosphate acyltransferase PlsY